MERELPLAAHAAQTLQTPCTTRHDSASLGFHGISTAVAKIIYDGDHADESKYSPHFLAHPVSTVVVLTETAASYVLCLFIHLCLHFYVGVFV